MERVIHSRSDHSGFVDRSASIEIFHQTRRARCNSGSASLQLVFFPGTVAPAFGNYVIFSQRFSADPSPLVHDGRVYVYTTHDGAGDTIIFKI